jgi:NAD(P)-dependent dehydrogenase (short-subunit alcohol dehydrogenase family)
MQTASGVSTFSKDALAGKVAIVTGSTRGIGRATAQAFAQAGARVVISSRKPEACEATCVAMREAGHTVVGVPCHIGKAEDLKRLVEATLDAFGRLDVVVCNAAINPVFSPLQDITEETWAKVFETNLTGIWRMAKLALPHIAAQGGGVMVLLSSTASLIGTDKAGPYAVSKAAENHLAKQLAVEWGPKNIRVNVIAPGLTRTDMIRNHDPAWVKRTVERTPLRRMGDPEDVAAVALFFASDAARHLTGQFIVVDGGSMLLGPG